MRHEENKRKPKAEHLADNMAGKIEVINLIATELMAIRNNLDARILKIDALSIADKALNDAKDAMEQAKILLTKLTKGKI